MTLQTVPAEAVTRFWANVECDLSLFGCWEWVGYRRNGYGSLSVHDRLEYAHRLSYLIHVGPIPDGHEVCHRCDNRRCIRPAHLFAAPHVDNVADMRIKGRGVDPPVLRGEAHPFATLTDAQVEAVRAAVAGGARQRDVAAAFGVSQSTVWRLYHQRVRTAA